MPKVFLEEHSGPWTEAEFLALDETGYRFELIDGGLWVTPKPIAPHQDISVRLSAALLAVADKVGLWVRPDINVRLTDGIIMEPDLVVSRGPRVVAVTDAADVLLVCEITSPSNAKTDRVLKKKLYADAKIKWYLLVEPDMSSYESVTLRLFRLGADGYETYTIAEGDEVLALDEPLPIKITANQLLGLRKPTDRA